MNGVLTGLPYIFFMKGTCIVIANRQGDYLLQFRDGNEGIPFPLSWDFFGGTLEEGETALQNALREIPEELGIAISEQDLQLLGVDDHVAVFRLVPTLEWGEFRVFEGAGCAFFSKEELRRLELPAYIRSIVEAHL